MYCRWRCIQGLGTPLALIGIGDWLLFVLDPRKLLINCEARYRVYPVKNICVMQNFWQI